jgi:exonuclease III
MKHLLSQHKFDLVAISESKRDADHPVTEIHNDYTWIGKDRTKGKGGGIGFLCNKNSLSIQDDDLLNSKSDDKERLWINVKVGTVSMAVGVVYFPVDNVVKEDSNQLHNELIVNIAHLQQKYEHILLMGDFNGKVTAFKDPDKISHNGTLLESLVETTGFTLLNLSEKCSGKVTWSRGNQHSTIDYALCSPGMYDLITSVLIDEDHMYSVGSDHNVMAVKANINPSSHETRKSEEVKRWNISENTNWTEFQQAIDHCLIDFKSTQYHNPDDMWKDIKAHLSEAGSKAVGYKNYKNKRAYWDKEIDKMIKDRRQASRMYRIWSGHPDSSPELLALLWDEYLEKKKQVSDKIKSNLIAHKTKVITTNAAKATKNPRAFWNMLRKLNHSSAYPLRIRDPDNHDNIIDDPIEIKKKLSTYWSSLGTNNSNAKPDLSAKVHQLEFTAPTPDSLHSVTIDEDSLKAAISKLKNGKATGVDNLPGEFIKYGGPKLHSVILDLLRLVKLTENLPQDWYEGIVKPIHKDGNREYLANYRGITISCVVYKVLVTIIEQQVMNFIEDKNLLGENHGAFRKGRRCEEHIFSLKGVCSIRKSAKQKTYLAFLDISKAFDTVDRDTLFHHLWNMGIQGKTWNIIRMLYSKVDNKVIFGQLESEPFEVYNGLKQGCVLSPTLFNLVMVDLESSLKGHGGVTIGSHTINGLFYADDIVLFANTEPALQDMLNVATQFGNKWGLRFNSRKSQVMIIGKKMV